MNQMQHEEGTFTGTGDLSLVWQAWLPDEPPRAVLVIVHGFGEHCGRYRHLVDYLVPRGFAIYGFDLRGHGRSEGQRGAINSWDEFREDVARFLHLVREAQPDSPLFLMGHSMGGLIVSNYAVNDQSGLTGVILSSPLLAQPHVAPLLHAASRVLSKIRPNMSFDAGVDASAISRDPAEVKRYVDDPLVHSKATPRFSTEMDKTIAWTQERASQLTVPLLVIHGDADQLVPIAGSQRFYRNASSADKIFKVYPGGYHESINDIHRDQVLADIHAWLERHLD
jgi:alpha-beta hydrolase superfamily lysophospholipase